MKTKRIIRIIVILLVFAALVAGFQDKLIFFPGAWPDGFRLAEKIDNCTLEQVTLQTNDGISLDAVFAKTTKPAGKSRTVLFSHGNAGNLLNRFGKVDRICEAGFDVLVYDYRGFGKSGGVPTVAGAIKDGMTALNWLISEKKIKSEDIVLYGESLGTRVAAEILKNSNASFSALVHESGFASLAVQAGRRIPLIGSYILKTDLPTSETLKNYHGRLLVIHSRKDEIIPFADGEMIFAACPSTDKTMYTIESSGHNDPVWKTREWLEHWQKLMSQL